MLNQEQSAGKCVTMSSAGFWSNYDCQSKFQSVCMTYNTIYTAPPKPTTAVPLKCANGWSDSDNACYKVHKHKL